MKLIVCQFLQAEAGQGIQLGRVLAVKNGGKFHVGTPYVEGATVKAEIVEDLKVNHCPTKRKP